MVAYRFKRHASPLVHSLTGALRQNEKLFHSGILRLQSGPAPEKPFPGRIPRASRPCPDSSPARGQAGRRFETSAPAFQLSSACGSPPNASATGRQRRESSPAGRAARLIERDALRFCKARRFGTPQRGEHRAAAECLADIGGKRADIGAFRTANVDRISMRGLIGREKHKFLTQTFRAARSISFPSRARS